MVVDGADLTHGRPVLLLLDSGIPSFYTSTLEIVQSKKSHLNLYEGSKSGLGCGPDGATCNMLP